MHRSVVLRYPLNRARYLLPRRGTGGRLVILLRELARKRACREEPLSPIVDSTAFAASLAQHLTIIFIDKPVCGRLTMRQTDCRGEAGGLSCVGRSARLDMRDGVRDY